MSLMYDKVVVPLGPGKMVWFLFNKDGTVVNCTGGSIEQNREAMHLLSKEAGQAGKTPYQFLTEIANRQAPKIEVVYHQKFNENGANP